MGLPGGPLSPWCGFLLEYTTTCHSAYFAALHCQLLPPQPPIPLAQSLPSLATATGAASSQPRNRKQPIHPPSSAPPKTPQIAHHPPAVCPPSPQLWHDSLAACAGADLQPRCPRRPQSPQCTCCKSLPRYSERHPPSALRAAWHLTYKLCWAAPAYTCSSAGVAAMGVRYELCWVARPAPAGTSAGPPVLQRDKRCQGNSPKHGQRKLPVVVS